LAEGGIAHDLSGGQGPAVLLFLGQLVAKGAGVVAEGSPHEFARQGSDIARANAFAEAKAIA